MLGIQNQPQLSYRRSLSFKGESDADNSVSNDKKEDFKTKLRNERDNAKAQAKQDEEGWNDFANELEKSDSKILGKGARFIASTVGVAGTFVVSKYSSKLTIETLKSLSKSPTMKSAIESIQSAKKPFTEALKGTKEFMGGLAEKPAVKKKLDAVKNSKVVKSVQEFMNNEKVRKITEPVRNTIDSIKDSKLDVKKAQNIAENTMAATATGSVIVDNLTGRNNDKSALELATGSSGEV